MNNYISLEQAKSHLVELGLYDVGTLPNDIHLEKILKTIESKINLWMGYSLIPAEYETERKSNRDGRIVLPKYPVIEVKSCQKILAQVIGQPSNIVDAPLAMRVDKNTIQVDQAYCLYRTIYTAGLDPLPDALAGLSDTVLNLFRKVVEAGGDVNVLSKQARFVQSTSMPNISQTFIVPGASAMGSKLSGGASKGFTELDAALSEYAQFKRSVFY